MRKEIIQFIVENGLSPFNNYKTSVKGNSGSFYKTTDAKAVHNKVLANISEKFRFPDASSLLQYFNFTNNLHDIKNRQEYFSKLVNVDRSFLSSIKHPKSTWKPSYSVIVVTEDDQVFLKLREFGCPAKLLISERDVMELQVYDVVQVINCEQYGSALEELQQAVFLKNMQEAYLERYVTQLSSWIEIIDTIKTADSRFLSAQDSEAKNLDILKDKQITENLKQTIDKVIPLLRLARREKKEILDVRKVEEVCEKMNSYLEEEMKNLTISGSVLMNALARGTIPDELKKIVQKLIKNSGFNEEIFIEKVPIEIDEVELDKLVRKQSIQGFTSEAEDIKKSAVELLQVPKLLGDLERELLLFDFESGIADWMDKKENKIEISDEFTIDNVPNIFLEKAQPISFRLDDRDRCSILTGANSGGKTTLLEHIIQSISLMQIGLPVNGNIKMPIFSEIYYFAKNKGSASKGAFETLLTQLAGIKSEKMNSDGKVLILADEIEAVTEPGVAGRIIAASADYFIQKGCFLVIATHLGQEIAKVLPNYARIDGIEAKGLDEQNELIVDHNPVLGRLASSTPELIVEKMAKKNSDEYLMHLWNCLEKSKK